MSRIDSLIMRDVTRSFGATTALHHFNLEISGGSFVTLLGPSGCGKTTALNCLAGLLDLSAGEIVLNGAPIHQQPAEQRGFGMVFQNYALFPHLNAWRNVSYGLEIRRVQRAERESRIMRALKMVHLEDFAKRYPAQLSGGQQQRLALARTIVLEPSLLLLDEPLSNLDANLRNEMRIEIKRIHTQLGLTTVFVTHDQSEAMTMSDTVVVMRAGYIEQVGAPDTIYLAPHSLYVASFMGYSNRLEATVVGREGESWVVQTAGGSRLRGSTTTGASFQVDEQVTLAFRPDDTLTEPSSAANSLSGTVQLVEYIGKGFEVVVRLDQEHGEQLLVHSTTRPESFAKLAFGINPERLLIFPRDEQPVTEGESSQAEPILSGKR